MAEGGAVLFFVTDLEVSQNRSVHESHERRTERKRERGWTDLDDSTDEDVVTLVVDTVLQHHLVHHGDEDLVLWAATNQRPRERQTRQTDMTASFRVHMQVT